MGIKSNTQPDRLAIGDVRARTTGKVAQWPYHPHNTPMMNGRSPVIHPTQVKMKPVNNGRKVTTAKANVTSEGKYHVAKNIA